MALWSDPANEAIEKAKADFESKLRAGALRSSEDEESKVVTDANVEHARKALLRGDGKRRWWSKGLIGLAEYGSSVFSAAGFLILGLKNDHPVAPDWIAWMLIAAGAAVFILLKQL